MGAGSRPVGLQLEQLDAPAERVEHAADLAVHGMVRVLQGHRPGAQVVDGIWCVAESLEVARWPHPRTQARDDDSLTRLVWVAPVQALRVPRHQPLPFARLGRQAWFAWLWNEFGEDVGLPVVPVRRHIEWTRQRSPLGAGMRCYRVLPSRGLGETRLAPAQLQKRATRAIRPSVVSRGWAAGQNALPRHTILEQGASEELAVCGPPGGKGCTGTEHALEAGNEQQRPWNDKEIVFGFQAWRKFSTPRTAPS